MSGNSNCCGREHCLGYCSRCCTRTHACVMAFPKTPAIIGWECLMERFVCPCLCLPQCLGNDVMEMKGPRTHVSSEMYLLERWDSGRAHVRRRGGSTVFRVLVMKNPPRNPVSFRGPVCCDWCFELCVASEFMSLLPSHDYLMVPAGVRVSLHAHTEADFVRVALLESRQANKGRRRWSSCVITVLKRTVVMWRGGYQAKYEGLWGRRLGPRPF